MHSVRYSPDGSPTDNIIELSEEYEHRVCLITTLLFVDHVALIVVIDDFAIGIFLNNS